MIVSTPNTPTFRFDDLPLHWQMTRWEKYALAGILEAARPPVAVEIGTYRGGSLQVIAQHSTKAYAIDISPACKEDLGGHFPNVEFLIGDSRTLLPDLLEGISARGEELGFILIDGDHSTEGVRFDIDAVLRYVPLRPLYVVFHDSFHPPCREGILTASWQACRHVHYVEVDFVPGVFHHDAFDTAPARSMFGGLAVALMLPEERREPLVVHQCQKGLFDAVLPHSRHAPRGPLVRLASRAWRRLRR